MFSKIKSIIKLLIPPLLLKLLKRARSQNTFEGIYNNFSEINNLTNYNDESSLSNTYEELVSKLRADESGVNLPISNSRSQITNLLPIFISSLSGKIHVLDYGGGAGETYIECSEAVNMEQVEYYIYDLPETIKIGEKIFSNCGINDCNNLYGVSFINDISKIETIDIVYMGSVLQYVSNYSELILSIINKSPTYFFITDNFMGDHSTFATTQVNMAGRRMAYWIFQLKEIVLLFEQNGYCLIYKSTNYQPFHNFDNFPEEYQVKDSCNLLFKRTNV